MMNLVVKKYLLNLLKISFCVLPVTAWAVAYTSPPTQGPLTLSTADTLTVTSGTMATPANDPTGFTVRTPTTGSNASDITVNSGASLSYLGSSSVGTIVSNRNDTSSGQITITNSGTISSGTGTSAISLTNSVGATADNSTQITLNSGSSVVGSIVTSGLLSAEIRIRGTATVNGSISLTPSTGGAAALLIGSGGAANFSTQGAINLGSTGDIQVLSGSTFNINSTVSASTIANSGTINLSNNVTLSGAFTNPSGATINSKQTTTLTAATYTVSSGATHNAVITDVNNYGNLTIVTADPSISSFALTYGGGYVPAGTYTLLTSPANTSVTISSTIPTATMFLTFAQPFKNSATTIQTTATRTGFQTYAQNPLTYQIGSVLEDIGADSPSSSMVALLNALEASSNADVLQSNLAQLEPLVTGPIASISIQNQPMQQAILHLDATRNEDAGYTSGSCCCQNGTWIRAFADRANQSAVDEIQGYRATNAGIAFGVDQNINDKTLFGLAGAYSLARVQDKTNSSSLTKIHSYQALVYGSYNFDMGAYLDFAFDAAFNDFTIDRYVNINPVNYLAQSEYWGQQYSALAIFGRPFSVIEDWQVTPEASLQYTYSPQYAYTESGGGVTNLRVNSNDSNLLQAGLGGKIIKYMTAGICSWAPELHGMVLYNIFNGNLNTISNFTAGGTNIASNYDLPRSGGRVGLAFTFAMADQLEFKVNYDCEFRSKYIDNAFYLNFKYLL